MTVNLYKAFERSSWWLDEIPCLHRLHLETPLQGAHKIQNIIGMSISLSVLESKLEELSENVQASNRHNNLQQKALLTFDDGHKDVLLAAPILKEFPEIQPVLFLTGRQLGGEVTPLPLTALYTWCEKNSRNPNELYEEFGFDRKSLKQLPEYEQRRLLKDAGIDIDPTEEEMLNLDEVNELVKLNWLIGYHGNHHCDLRIHKASELQSSFKRDIDLLKELGFVPWIAWPEGRWNNELFLMANELGFTAQFGLLNEKGVGTNTQILKRVIWK